MQIREKLAAYDNEGQSFYSFEYFPPKTDAGLQNLYPRLDRMASLDPAFIDITWGAGGSTAERTLDLSMQAQRLLGVDVMMHITCTNMPVELIRSSLRSAKNAGIENFLALRGDPPNGQEKWTSCEGGLAYGSDLVRLIREEFGQSVSIGVAGYPQGHLEAKDLESDIQHLKIKVDAGADFIITQLFYDSDTYFHFVERCRGAGIEVPIVPGIMPIHNYQRLRKFTELAGIDVPQKILNDLEPISSDDERVREYGVNQCVELSKTLLEGGAPGIHFYTLNLESIVAEVVKTLGLHDANSERRELPWRRSSLRNRRQEDVRPIFWSNRPKSYLARTSSWDDYPNGRWGNTASPTFGELNDYHLFSSAKNSEAAKQQKLKLWGSPTTVEEVSELFQLYCRGKVERLPWCELPVQGETGKILDRLLALNSQGFLTINSQPQINGAPSNDPQVGWGGPNGRVYQKAYVEFFVHKDIFNEKIHGILEQLPSLTYQASPRDGNIIHNYPKGAVNALTWGSFPGREILQPTVVDTDSFEIWKKEAFALWTEDWANCYPEGSASYRLLHEIQENFMLVNIVENDYIEGNIFRWFENYLEI